MDNSFKKMVLVNPEMYKQSITEKKLNSLDQDLGEILNSSLPDDEKAKRYVATLKTHKILSATRPKLIDAEKEMLSSVKPPNQKLRAKELLELIKPYLLWNDDGEILVND